MLRAQNGLVTREQAMSLGLTRSAIGHRLSVGGWQAVLPSVYATTGQRLTRRQQLVAACLYVGEECAIEGADACLFFGLRYGPPPSANVHLLVPWGHKARSRGFVIVRRTTSALRSVSDRPLRFVEPATAVVATTRRMRDVRAATALLAEVVQRRITSYDELLRAHQQCTPRGARLTAAALERVGAGVLSAPEAEVRQLAKRSRILPEPLFNPLLRLPDGSRVSPDALFADAALVHETNGRSAHDRTDLFEDCRSDMTA